MPWGTAALRPSSPRASEAVPSDGTRTANVSRQFLRHTLAVAEVMVAFEVACQNREGVEFIRPEEILAAAPEATRRLRLPFRWQVEVQEGGKLHGLGVEPDRVFGLSFAGAPEHRRLAYFFLEADRGTMPVTRKGLGQTSFRRKLLGYRETWRQGLHRTHLGIPNFRVLTVTTNEERMRHLAAGCRSLGGGQRLFLFAGQEALRRGDIFGYRWVNGFGEVRKEEGCQSARPRELGYRASLVAYGKIRANAKEIHP